MGRCATLEARGAFQHVFADFLGRRYNSEEILTMFGPSEEGMIQRLIPGGYEPAYAEFLAEYERLHNGRSIAFPGIERALELLQERGIILGVVTGKGPATAAISFRHLGLEHYFDIVQAGSPEGGVKPQSMRRVLERWGLPPGEVAYLGDSPSDMADAIRRRHSWPYLTLDRPDPVAAAHRSRPRASTASRVDRDRTSWLPSQTRRWERQQG
jgi:phosphoglycolate phosphatase-like HAD superfamily hydrolase